MSSRILVTGAAGFIGSKICEYLLAAGYGVLGIDNLNNAYDVRLKHWRLARLRDRAGFDFCALDICEPLDLQELARLWNDQEFSAVINLAARAGVQPSVANPWIYFKTNVTGTLNLLEFCRQQGIQKFVLSSTSSLYGAHNSMPFKEDADTSHPLSPYAASKKAAETLCYSYHHLHKLDVTILRYFTVYGPAGRPDMSLFRFVQRISEQKPVTVYGDGTQSRDFTYIDDIACGTIAGLKPLGFAVINLGSDSPLVLRDAIEQIEVLTGKQAIIECQPRHPADIPASWANIERARDLLGWTPRVQYGEGLKNLVDWYLENQSWAKEIITA